MFAWILLIYKIHNVIVLAVCNNLLDLITGASYIKMLLAKNKLQCLSVGGNAIGNDGVRLISEGLLCNNTLTKLYVWRCGISVEGN